jgi:hypothetical protein
MCRAPSGKEMNERIKLLAEQATLAVTKPDGHYIVQAWQAKFAELIVKECVHTVRNRGGMCGALASNWIEEHFGVEE